MEYEEHGDIWVIVNHTTERNPSLRINELESWKCRLSPSGKRSCVPRAL